MPELPEVETIARGVASRARGERIESVWLSGKPQSLKSPAQDIVRTLEGACIADVRRVGKHIVVDLERGRDEAKLASAARNTRASRPRPHEKCPPAEGGRATPAETHPQWIVHLGMTGSLTVVPAETLLEKHTHAILRLSSGQELRFVDPRRFGRLAVAQERFRAPGEEPLDVAWESFAPLFKQTRAFIKSALLNQKLLSGVGNIYADEALFRARIRPRRRGPTLTRAELRRLYHALQQVLRQAIAAGGSSISDYVDAAGEPGLFQFEHRVYGREGERCVRCKTQIKRVVISGRSAHYCPQCQR